MELLNPGLILEEEVTKAAVTPKRPEAPEPPPGGSRLPKIPPIPSANPWFSAGMEPRLWSSPGSPSSSSKPRWRLLEIPASPSPGARARGRGERKIRVMPFPKKPPKCGKKWHYPGFFWLIFMACMERLPRDTTAVPSTWKSCEEPKFTLKKLGMVD